MSNLNIANRYANALMKLAVDKSMFDAVSSDIELIYNTMRSSRQLQVALCSPVIKPELKLKSLTEIFQSRISPVSMSFIQFIVKKNREAVLFNIAKQFLELRDRELGIVNAEIISSSHLSNEQKERLKARFEEMTGKKVRFSYSLSSNIIGGFIVRVNDTVYDASIRHQLDLLKDKLLKENYSMN